MNGIRCYFRVPMRDVAKYLVVYLLLLFSIHCAAQNDFEWQDPLDTPWVNVGDKWNIIYNIIGVTASQFIPYDTLKLNGQRKKWYLSSYLDYQMEYKNRPPQSDAYSIRFRIEQHLRPWLSLGGELGPMFTVDDEGWHYGMGSMVVFNWYLINAGKHKLNFENSFGTILFNAAFPFDGTAFNFNYYYGFIYKVNLNDRTKFDIGFRNQHISNGGLFDDSNPGYDGYGFRVGFSKTFTKSEHEILPWKDSFLNPF